eukprot:jgi/Mesvir1/28250/Mv26211-RA.1
MDHERRLGTSLRPFPRPSSPSPLHPSSTLQVTTAPGQRIEKLNSPPLLDILDSPVGTEYKYSCSPCNTLTYILGHAHPSCPFLPKPPPPHQAALANHTSAECTFQPDTGTAELVISQSRHVHRLGETFLEKIERLAFRDKERQEAMRDAIAHNHYKALSFRPKISESSRRMARSKTVDELIQNNESKVMKEAARVTVEEELKKQCPFQPQLIAKKKDVNRSISYLEPETIVTKLVQDAKRKERELEEARIAKELAELQECTFTPALSGWAPPVDTGPVVVRGLGRHMELKQLAKSLEEERLEREKKAFLLDVTGVREPMTTVPEPFRLSGGGKAAELRRQQLMEEIQAERLKECTFQPKTNEATNRQIINRILQSPGIDDGLLST